MAISPSGVTSPPPSAAPPNRCRPSECWRNSGHWYPAAAGAPASADIRSSRRPAPRPPAVYKPRSRAPAVAANQLLEGMDMVDPHQMVDLLTRPRKCSQTSFSLRRPAPPAGTPSPVSPARCSRRSRWPLWYSFLSPPYPRAIVHRPADIAFADAMAGADRRAVGQRRHPSAFGAAPPAPAGSGSPDAAAAPCRSASSAAAWRSRWRPHQHAAKQGFAVLTDDDFLNLLRTVGPLIALAARRALLRIAKRGYVNPQQLQFGAHVGAAKAGVLSCEGGRGDPRHLITRRHRAVNFIIPQGAFAYRQHVRVSGAALAVDANPPRSPTCSAQPRASASCGRILPRRPPCRPPACRRRQSSAAGHRPRARWRWWLCWYAPHAEGDDLLPQHRRPAVIQLDGHQVRGKLHHVRLQPQLFQGVGGLQPEQAAPITTPVFAAAAWAAIRSRSSRVR